MLNGFNFNQLINYETRWSINTNVMIKVINEYPFVIEEGIIAKRRNNIYVDDINTEDGDEIIIPFREWQCEAGSRFLNSEVWEFTPELGFQKVPFLETRNPSESNGFDGSHTICINKNQTFFIRVWGFTPTWWEENYDFDHWLIISQ